MMASRSVGGRCSRPAERFDELPPGVCPVRELLVPSLGLTSIAWKMGKECGAEDGEINRAMKWMRLI